MAPAAVRVRGGRWRWVNDATVMMRRLQARLLLLLASPLRLLVNLLLLLLLLEGTRGADEGG